jgi:RNA polymerase sigma-70 factor, ECF subfamily
MNQGISMHRFEGLVHELERPLGRFIAQMVTRHGVAEDVLQETFYIAWRERARMPRGESERRAWMFGIARHQALHALRTSRRHRRIVDAVITNGPAVELSAPNESRAMADLLTKVLRADDRSLFILRYVYGFSAEALGDMTGKRPAAIRKRLERSASTLRTVLATPPFVDEDPINEPAIAPR